MAWSLSCKLSSVCLRTSAVTRAGTAGVQHFVGRIWRGRTGTADLHELYSICSLARDLPPYCFSLLHFSTSSAFGSGSTGQAKQLNTAALYWPVGTQEEHRRKQTGWDFMLCFCVSS